MSVACVLFEKCGGDRHSKATLSFINIDIKKKYLSLKQILRKRLGIPLRRGKGVREREGKEMERVGGGERDRERRLEI